MHVPQLIKLLFTIQTILVMMTEMRCASNAKAKRELTL